LKLTPSNDASLNFLPPNPGGVDKTTVAVAADHDTDATLIAALVQALKARR
jgi:hypothetical protein